VEELGHLDLHKRARDTTTSLRQLVVALSTAGAGFFYNVLATQPDSPLHFGRGCLVLFGVATLAGMAAYFSDARWNYWWALECEANATPGKAVEKFYPLAFGKQEVTPAVAHRKGDRWWTAKYVADSLCYLAFASAVTLAVMSVF
jgi:hypothetical protein